jgi:hypothetical protein
LAFSAGADSTEASIWAFISSETFRYGISLYVFLPCFPFDNGCIQNFQSTIW